MKRKHYGTISYRHEYREPDGLFGHRPTYTGERLSVHFDWNRALVGLAEILGVPIASVKGLSR